VFEEHVDEEDWRWAIFWRVEWCQVCIDRGISGGE